MPTTSDALVGVGTQLAYQISPATFFVSDAKAKVTLIARLADGSPLPSWLRFDPATGLFTGQPPVGARSTYAIDVIAALSTGEQARSSFRIHVSNGKSAGSGAAPAPAAPRLDTGTTGANPTPGASVSGNPVLLSISSNKAALTAPTNIPSTPRLLPQFPQVPPRVSPGLESVFGQNVEAGGVRSTIGASYAGSAVDLAAMQELTNRRVPGVRTVPPMSVPVGSVTSFTGSGAAPGSYAAARIVGLQANALSVPARLMAGSSGMKNSEIVQPASILLGEFPVAEDGSFAAALELPTGITPGAYVIQMSAFNSEGAAVDFQLPLSVTAAGRAEADSLKLKAGRAGVVRVLSNDTGVAGSSPAQAYDTATLCLLTGTGTGGKCVRKLSGPAGVFSVNRTSGSVSFTASKKAKPGATVTVRYGVRDVTGGAVSSTIAVRITR